MGGVHGRDPGGPPVVPGAVVPAWRGAGRAAASGFHRARTAGGPGVPASADRAEPGRV